jgi:hypothetical protein
MFSASISTIVSVRRSTVPLLSVGEDDFDQLDVDQGMERCPVFLERAVPDSLIGTSRRPRSPKRTPNRPEPTASRQRRTSRDSIICRSFASHAARCDSLKIVVSPVRVRVSPSESACKIGGFCVRAPRARKGRKRQMAFAGCAVLRGKRPADIGLHKPRSTRCVSCTRQ